MVLSNEIKDFSLLDLVDPDKLQEIQDAFADANQVGSVITDIYGKALTRPSNFSRLCQLIRQTSKGLHQCEESDRILGERATATGRPVFAKCYSCGLYDASAPIIVGGKHIANWLIGQVKTKDINRGELLRYAGEIRMDAEVMLDAFNDIQVMSTERFSKIIKLLWCLANEISTLGFNNLKLAHEMEKQKKTEEKAVKAFENCADLIVISSLCDGRLVEANAAFFNLTGYSREEMIGRAAKNLWVIQHPEEKRALAQRLLKQGSVRGIEFSLRLKSGEVRIGLCSAETMEINGEKQVVWVWHDITERKKTEEHLAYLSSCDTLTGLYNRRMFEETIGRFDQEKKKASVIVCDVDGLKRVNDTMGHAAGDELLKVSASILARVVGDQGMVARIGGDEFVVILPGCAQSDAERLCTALRIEVVHYNLHEQELYLSLSLGMAGAGDQYVNIYDLYKEADNNMYREKMHRSRSSRHS